MSRADDVLVRTTRPSDFEDIAELTRRVYPETPPWSTRQLTSHLAVFPEGQFVALERDSRRVVGMAASLVVLWDDYELSASWRDFTDQGMFTNHDPVRGRTLYAAEVMVDPEWQGRGVGTLIYGQRRALVERMGLLRIRAGSRLRGYHRFAKTMSAEEYAVAVVRGDVFDPTLSFQLHRGFRVIAVVGGYLAHDPDSLGHAAVIEWLNPAVAGAEHWAGQPARFAPPPSKG